MSSELSDALNPNIVRARPQPVAYDTSDEYLDQDPPEQWQPILIRPPENVAHRSELEFAIVEPSPPPRVPTPESHTNDHFLPHSSRTYSQPYFFTSGPGTYSPTRSPSPTRLPEPDAARAAELARLLAAATQQATELERQRRLEWEREQEAQYKQRQAELESQLLSMRNELTSLKTIINTSSPPASSPVATTPVAGLPPVPTPSLTHNTPSRSRRDSVPPPRVPLQPMFVEGSSRQPIRVPTGASCKTSMSLPFIQYKPPVSLATPPAPPPPITPAEAPAALSSDEESFTDEDSEEETPPPDRPLKRKSTRDTRCLTIQHAIRLHMLRVMRIRSDKALPDSHVEGAPLPLSAPVRFVWEKTVLRSKHNQRMKRRTLEDLRAHRRRYRHVPDADFERRALELAFDQTFATFRRKFRAQRDEFVAEQLRRKEDTKTFKSRRMARKKNKLASRLEARKTVDTFAHAAFNGAFLIDCISSDESEDDPDESDGSPQPLFSIGDTPDAHLTPPPPKPRGRILVSRPPSWRSSRLGRLYAALDTAAASNAATKTKRGLGRKKRTAGAPKAKEGRALPPRGVGRWMVSARWVRDAVAADPKVEGVLSQIVAGVPELDWETFTELGPASDEEEQGEGMSGVDDGQDELVHQPVFAPRMESGSSLQYALVSS